MTREEAIATLQEKYDYCKSFYDLAAYPEISYPETAKYMQALQVALSALRPVSRERVERVWKSEWVDNGERDSNGVPKPFAISCKRCGSSAGTTWMSFCPTCGAPMTDEAVEMVMERLEALHSETKTD